MSLEQTIADNTAAVVALTTALNKPLWLKPSVDALTDVQPVKTNTSPAAVVGAIAGAVVKETAAAPAAELVQVTITDVLNLASQLIASKGKDVLNAALAPFQVKSIKAIPAEKLGEVKTAIQAALEAPKAAA